MVKKDLVNRLAVYFPEFRKKDLEYLVDLLFEKLTEALVEGHRIEIRGFGRFLLRQQKERLFTNPKTQEVRKLPSRKRIIFKPGKDIKERLNQPAYASLDLGTQTFRLLIGKAEEGRLRVLFRTRENVRLGEGLTTGRITPAAMERGLLALRRFQEHLRRFEVAHYLAAGTAVFRRAQNAPEFLKRAREEIGLEIQVLSPEEEAQLTLKGVLLGLQDKPETFLVADVGGGSTELVWGRGEEAFWKTSLPLGAVVLFERFFKKDPPSPEEIEKTRKFIRENLKDLPEEIRRAGVLIGTGGTASCLAALDLELEAYYPEVSHGHRLEAKVLERIARELSALTRAERSGLRGMEGGREDIILPGLLIYLELLAHLGFEHLVVSESGILEGLLLRSLELGSNF